MLKVFAVRDVKADAYASLIALPTVGLAARGFVDACANPQGPLRQYPEDYSLYELGEFDPSSGTISGYPLPKLIMSAVEALASVRKVDERQLEIPGLPKAEGVR